MLLRRLTRVVNVRVERCDVYIGRTCHGYASLGWGNPFSIFSREENINRFTVYIHNYPELFNRIIPELRGKKLGCWCHPLPCHGDILCAIANGEIHVA